MKWLQKIDSPILCLFFISALLVTIWFRNGNLFQGAEEGTPFYNVSHSLVLYSHTWIGQFLGAPFLPDTTKMPLFTILAFLQNIGISCFLLQVGLFLGIIFGSSLAVYFMFRQLLSLNKWFCFVGGLFYICNPYAISEVWSRGLYTQFFAFLLVPLFLLQFIYAIERKKRIYLLVGVLLSFVCSTALGNPAYIITLWTPVFCFCLFKSYSKRHFLMYPIGSFFIYLILWILVNVWWLGVVLPFSTTSYTGNGSVFDNALETLKGISSQLPFENAIRLYHQIRFGSDMYGSVYDNILLQTISWCIPYIALFSFFLFRRKELIFFSILFVVGLFVSLGSNPPFGNVFVFLFNHITPLQVFRNPYEKFGLVYLLGYTGLFTLGFYRIWLFLEGFKKRYLSLQVSISLLILVNILFCFPLWTGSVVEWGMQTTIPAQYSVLENRLRDLSDADQNIFFLPYFGNLGIEYKWGNASYHGTDPLFQVLNMPVITQPGLSPYLTALKQSASDTNLTGALSLIKVKYLIERTDVVVPQSESKKQDFFFHLKLLQTKTSSDDPLIRGVKLDTIAGMTAYEIVDSKPVGDIQFLNKLIEVNDFHSMFNKAEANQNALDLTGFILSKQNDKKIVPPISVSDGIFTKKDDLRFYIEATNSSDMLLQLNQTFSPEWKIIPNWDEGVTTNNFFNNIRLIFAKPINEENHFIVNGYANLWHLQQVKKLALVYRPQVVLDLLWPISLFFTSILFLITIVYFLRSSGVIYSQRQKNAK